MADININIKIHPKSTFSPPVESLLEYDQLIPAEGEFFFFVTWLKMIIEA